MTLQYRKRGCSVVADVHNIGNLTMKTYGRLDVACNNSGLLPVTANLVAQTEEDLNKIAAVDMKGIFLCIKYQIWRGVKMAPNENKPAAIEVANAVVADGEIVG